MKVIFVAMTEAADNSFTVFGWSAKVRCKGAGDRFAKISVRPQRLAPPSTIHGAKSLLQ